MRQHISFLAALLVTLAQAGYLDTAIHCRNQEYCSAGKIEGYFGPLDKPEQIQEAFRKTHWKKELIIFAESAYHRAAHAIDRYRREGYAHVLTILSSADECGRLIQAFKMYDHRHPHERAGNLSCGWYRNTDDSGNHIESGFEYMKFQIGAAAWWWKYFTAARAVALGYNMMAIDQDTMMTGDFYRFAKSPAGREYNMWFQAEDPNAINAGTVRVRAAHLQNANPAGPSFYLLYEATHRAVRWSEDASLLSALDPALLLGEKGRFYRQEQTILTDTLFSCMAGRPVHRAIMYEVRRDDAWAKIGGKEAYQKYIDSLTIDRWWYKTLTLDRELADYVGGEAWPDMAASARDGEGRTNVTFRTATLYQPHANGQYPMLLGGRLFSDPGPLTRAFRQSFRDLGVPQMPDQDDPSQAAAANATKPELFAFTNIDFGDHFRGGWLESTWLFYGRYGYWNKAMSPRHTNLMSHVHAHLGASDESKVHVLQHIGWHNWHLAASLAGGPAHIFFATQQDEHALMTLSRGVVAYAPGVIHYGLSRSQYLDAVEALGQVAVALNAVAAWPPADCSSDWVLTESGRNLTKPIRHTVPWVHLNTRHMVQAFGQSVDQVKCDWTGFFTYGCTRNNNGHGRGLLGVEFDALLELKNVHGPDAEHTLRLVAPPGSNPAPPPALSTAVTGVRHSDLVSWNADLVLGLSRWGQPLWLDRLVSIEGGLGGRAAAAYTAWRTQCRGLRYRELAANERDDF
ncbi:hypothetical protein CHLRE_06g309550v5 [Chlamydomonas reinhardtii]|uniref:Nucleotide-diphospho-sugar transferase domain-containing protein n=1 Tax=Chlamydomonas reinhardtii TaxID=3055 RepID=A0A2K3DRI5_CHLRE|nr:uncharacterized protein CHLRE_06g309550v5 [Chlamydomonas reinhardtii]PNW83165.1 hypothetical protein CHLRE_06g309550v5 [Chlamydomonas reinhardtii]